MFWGVLSVRPLLDISLFSFSFFQPPTLAGAVVLLNPGKRTKTLITGFSDLTTFRFTLEWFIRLQPVPRYGTSRYPLYILPPPPLRYILSSLFAFFSRDTELYVFCFVRHGKSLLSRLYRPLSFFFFAKIGDLQMTRFLAPLDIAPFVFFQIRFGRVRLNIVQFAADFYYFLVRRARLSRFYCAALCWRCSFYMYSVCILTMFPPV